MITTATSQDIPLGLAYTDYTLNRTLQGLITNVVDAIIEQDSTDRGAWDKVIAKRISLSSSYSEYEVTREIRRMLSNGVLYELCYEILYGTFHMTYLRNSSELLGSASETEEQDK